MNINFIWIGDIVPPSFIENYKKCATLNPHHTINLFRDKDLENFAKQYGILDIYNQVNLVNRINLAKYLSLFYYPGLYSDLDIIWKRPVDSLIEQNVNTFYNGAYWPNRVPIHQHPEFISCVRPYLHVYNNEYVYIIDDHLIYSTSYAIQKIINYSASKWQNLAFNMAINFEPFGPVSITEMVYDNKIKANLWYDAQCQGNGTHCTHISTRLWDSF